MHFLEFNKISDNEFEQNCNNYDKLVPGLKSINMMDLQNVKYS